MDIMESFNRFDEIVDIVQRTKTIAITDSQKEALKKKYKFTPHFEYGMDEESRYVIRTTKEMHDQMEYYMALEHERELIDLLMEAEIDRVVYVSVSYGTDALHLKELFQFLAENQ
ncbi:DUF3909 family protein [Bacillus sp. 165]|uniref:DUF3909 family protein n=1 Tax=Bacillus sp. 165 TaxID=1529117 RepID=UPI001ADCAC99|nr:DUF3909 family protein [Bacillus sp. 165]MBO9129866.1 DUF3909 family protein [Bacillus sp. 165]